MYPKSKAISKNFFYKGVIITLGDNVRIEIYYSYIELDSYEQYKNLLKAIKDLDFYDEIRIIHRGIGKDYENAYRVTKYAKMVKKEQELILKLFSSVIENKNLDDLDVLHNACDECGCDWEHVYESLNSNRFIDEVIFDKNLAVHNNISTLPVLIINRRYTINKLITEHTLIRILKELHLREKKTSICQGDNCF